MWVLRLSSCLIVAALAACVGPQGLVPVQSYDPGESSTSRFKAVLIAGDASIGVFDNAVSSVADILARRGVTGSAVQRLSAAPSIVAEGGVRPASLDNVLAAIADMRPAPGQGCFVFATSHGVAHRGLALATTDETLSPEALDRALEQGCGSAPTAVVVSGCYTGTFARAPMARANRVVLTAARPDRPSFGCGADQVYTFFDRCLIDAMATGASWQEIYATASRCVRSEERRGRYPASDPQFWLGSAAAGIAPPGAPDGEVR